MRPTCRPQDHEGLGVRGIIASEHRSVCFLKDRYSRTGPAQGDAIVDEQIVIDGECARGKLQNLSSRAGIQHGLNPRRGIGGSVTVGGRLNRPIDNCPARDATDRVQTRIPSREPHRVRRNVVRSY